MDESYWKDRRVLITGGAGFLGKHLVRKLLNKKAIVRIVDITNATFPKSDSTIDFRIVDVRDKEKIEESMKNIDVVFHLASVPSLGNFGEKVYFEINTRGTLNVLASAYKRDVRKVVHISSSTVYGIPSCCPIQENCPLRPIGPYGRSKVEAERRCLEFVSKGLDVTIIRPRVIVGRGRLGVFFLLFERIMKNKNIYLIGKGDNVFQFTHVSDMVEACIKAAQLEGSDIFNIGCEKVMSVREELAFLIKYANSKSKICFLPAKLSKFFLRVLNIFKFSPLVAEQFNIADVNFMLDISYAKRKLKWSPRYSNIEALIDGYRWFLNNRSQIPAHYREILGLLGRFKYPLRGQK